MKKLTKESYEKFLEGYGSDINSEGYEGEQIYDLARCVIDARDSETKAVTQYLNSIGVSDVLGRLADDMSCAANKSRRNKNGR